MGIGTISGPVLTVLTLLIGVSPMWAQEKFFVVTPKPTVTVTGTATLVAAENTSRVALSCTNNDAEIHVRWGDSTVTATRGEQIPARTSIEIKVRGAVYMVAEADSVQVSCVEQSQ